MLIVAILPHDVVFDVAVFVTGYLAAKFVHESFR